VARKKFPFDAAPTYRHRHRAETGIECHDIHVADR
jgi:hypothetical protein